MWLKNTVLHPRVQMAFCLPGIKMDDEIYIMGKNDVFKDGAIKLYTLFKTCLY